MNSTVDIRIEAGIIIYQRLYDGLRFLRCRGVVKINQIVSVYFLMEDRKLCADGFHIQLLPDSGRQFHDQASRWSLPAMMSETKFRMIGFFIEERVSVA